MTYKNCIAMIYIIDQLQQGKQVRSDLINEKMEITRSSFNRIISLIKCYLHEEYYLTKFLIYDRDKKTYLIIDE